MKVLLFDIDGTLIRSGGAGLKALLLAIEEVFQVENPQSVPLHGCTDRGIARDLFQVNGVEPSEANWFKFQESYLSHLQAQLPLATGHVLPGVLELLDPLHNHPQVYLGLLTGNVRRGAALKLGHYQLDHYFRGGGFGDDHPERNDVARAARASIEQELGMDIDIGGLWVIGDTPNDVRCGRAIDAQVLAVCTGGSQRDDLVESKPDLLVDDLTECRVWLEAILAS